MTIRDQMDQGEQSARAWLTHRAPALLLEQAAQRAIDLHQACPARASTAADTPADDLPTMRSTA